MEARSWEGREWYIIERWPDACQEVCERKNGPDDTAGGGLKKRGAGPWKSLGVRLNSTFASHFTLLLEINLGTVDIIPSLDVFAHVLHRRPDCLQTLNYPTQWDTTPSPGRSRETDYKIARRKFNVFSGCSFVPVCRSPIDESIKSASILSTNFEYISLLTFKHYFLAEINFFHCKTDFNQIFFFFANFHLVQTSFVVSKVVCKLRITCFQCCLVVFELFFYVEISLLIFKFYFLVARLTSFSDKNILINSFFCKLSFGSNNFSCFEDFL